MPALPGDTAGWKPALPGLGAAGVRLGAYTVGRIEFDGCDVSGAGCLVDVKDLRPIKLPPNVAPEDNPDNRPGVIALRGTTWRSESKTAVAHAALGGGAASRKRICISDVGNAWPDGVAVAADLPQGWEVRGFRHGGMHDRRPPGGGIQRPWILM